MGFNSAFKGLNFCFIWYIHTYNFGCGFLWMWISVFHIEERTDTACIWKTVLRKLFGSNRISRKRMEEIIWKCLWFVLLIKWVRTVNVVRSAGHKLNEQGIVVWSKQRKKMFPSPICLHQLEDSQRLPITG